MTSLMTTAPVISTTPDWIPTGNLYVSLPEISRADAGIYRFGVVKMNANALVDLVGSVKDHQSFLQPYVELDGQRLPLADLTWVRLDYWLPRFYARAGELEVIGTIFAPPGEKGFVYLLEVRSEQVKDSIRLGVEGWWKGLEMAVFKSRPVEAACSIQYDDWSRSLYGEARAGLPLLAWGLQPSQEGELSIQDNYFRWTSELALEPGQQAQMAFYVAVNLESDGARTGALHLRRRGWQSLLAETRQWLQQRNHTLQDRALERVLNENLFFNYYYAQGLCLDSGELALMTSRSVNYYVCAAYWARDALLWSFPALLLTDPAQARAALQVALTRYLPHAGEHALYINGVNLYPGFELDEACAPIIALGHYLDFSEDWQFLQQEPVQAAMHQSLAVIMNHFEPATGLYRTFLTPHDDPTNYPFLTYNNVLVWRTFAILKHNWNHLAREKETVKALGQRAEHLKATILKKCVLQGPWGEQFAGAIDAGGIALIEDIPGGSWSLFPYYHFCSPEDPVYRNSVRWIHSNHNPYFYSGKFSGAGAAHFPYPSSFDLANRLLCREQKALSILCELSMDHGLTCESFDAHTGVVKTGAAFATMSGFLAYCLHTALSQ